MSGWRLSEKAGLVIQDGLVFLGLLDRGEVLALDSTAPLVLQIALEETEDDVVCAVAAAAGAEPDDVREDVETFLAQMEAIGVLHRRP